MNNGSKVFYCSFCGKDESKVTLIAGPSVNICSECVCLCNDILLEKHQEAIEKITSERDALLNHITGESNE